MLLSIGKRQRKAIWLSAAANGNFLTFHDVQCPRSWQVANVSLESKAIKGKGKRKEIVGTTDFWSWRV